MKLVRKRGRQNARVAEIPSGKAQVVASQGVSPVATDWMQWWVAAVMLMLASNPRWLADRIPLFPAFDDSVLSRGSIWNAPLAGFGGSWPFLLYAAIAGCVVASLSQRCVRVLRGCIVVVSIIGLCSTGANAQLSAAMTMLAAVALIDQFGKSTVNSLKSAAGFTATAMFVGAAAIASTLEFGFPLFVLTVGLLEHTLMPRHITAPPFQNNARVLVSEPRRYRWFVSSCWIASMLIPGLLLSGYWDALLRPVSWLWLQPPVELLPSMAPIWGSSDVGIAHLAALLLVVNRWWNEFHGNSGSIGSVFALGVLTVITLGSVRYFWLGVIAIGLITPLPESLQGVTRPVFRGASTVCAAVAAVFMVIQLGMHAGTIVSADLVSKVVDPTTWSVSGKVLLTNLDQSTQWQSSGLQKEFQLVVSDRWDIYAGDYPQYSHICEDWKHWRREAYVRSDGTWGGYQDVFVKWNPAFVVVDSKDVQTIRQVALDSNWKPLGIDQVRTIFGDPRASTIRVQADKAARLFSFLEMPRSETQFEFETTLGLGDPQGSYVVANVLTAMRLPYAALRLLDDQDSIHHRLSRAYAFIEIAHRTKRYSGQSSLVDVVRAWTMAEQLESSWRLASPERSRIYRALAALDYEDVISTSTNVVDSQQQRIRTATARGHIVEARELAKGIPQRLTREFFLTALANHASANETLERLMALKSSALDEHLRTELHFYIGCAATEVADMRTAKKAFEEVARDTGSPFNALARLYLAMGGA